MARVKISEYRAKKLLLGDAYGGISIRDGEKARLPKGKDWVVKVDQGVKKRMKQGLLAVGVDAREAQKHLGAWKEKGYSRFLLEPLLPHESADEQYLSLERVREGIRVMHAHEGGIEIESHPEKVMSTIARSKADAGEVAKKTGLPEKFLAHVLKTFDEHHFAFLEINPLVVQGGKAYPLDAAALVDSAAAFFGPGWGEDDIVKARSKHPAEARIEAMAATTPASLKLSVLNPDGSLFFLLSGGGGSIVIADEAQSEGAGKEIGNYGEYSGGPSREEVYLYAREVIGLLVASKAKKKALIIAGGVANFTDIAQTFAGIIDALSENADTLRRAGVKVFVRRGGPNEKAGLASMCGFLEAEKLLGAIHGSDAPITAAVEEAIHFTKI